MYFETDSMIEKPEQFKNSTSISNLLLPLSNHLKKIKKKNSLKSLTYSNEEKNQLKTHEYHNLGFKITNREKTE